MPQSVNNILALDLSTSTGWSYFKGTQLVDYGSIVLKVPDLDYKDPHANPNYPYNLIDTANKIAEKIYEDLAVKYDIGIIYTEETCKSRHPISQKILEFIHYAVCSKFRDKIKIVYVRNNTWRKASEVYLRKDEKKQNLQVNKIKKKTGNKLAKVGGKVVGKLTSKHLAVLRVKELFNIDLKLNENDIADAILLGRYASLK